MCYIEEGSMGSANFGGRQGFNWELCNSQEFFRSLHGRQRLTYLFLYLSLSSRSRMLCLSQSWTILL